MARMGGHAATTIRVAATGAAAGELARRGPCSELDTRARPHMVTVEHGRIARSDRVKCLFSHICGQCQEKVRSGMCQNATFRAKCRVCSQLAVYQSAALCSMAQSGLIELLRTLCDPL